MNKCRMDAQGGGGQKPIKVKVHLLLELNIVLVLEEATVSAKLRRLQI